MRGAGLDLAKYFVDGILGAIEREVAEVLDRRSLGIGSGRTEIGDGERLFK